MEVPPAFTADIPVGPSKELLVSQGPYNDKEMFLIWNCILFTK